MRITLSKLSPFAQFGWQKADIMGHGIESAGLLNKIGDTKPKVDGEGQEAGPELLYLLFQRATAEHWHRRRSGRASRLAHRAGTRSTHHLCTTEFQWYFATIRN
jgi:hypothetical protein